MIRRYDPIPPFRGRAKIRPGVTYYVIKYIDPECGLHYEQGPIGTEAAAYARISEFASLRLAACLIRHKRGSRSDVEILASTPAWRERQEKQALAAIECISPAPRLSDTATPDLSNVSLPPGTYRCVARDDGKMDVITRGRDGRYNGVASMPPELANNMCQTLNILGLNPDATN